MLQCTQPPQWQTVISASSTSMLCFLSLTHTAGDPILCSALYHTGQHPMMLPLLEDVHITKGDFPCPSWTAELSHTKAGLCTDFHFEPLKLAHWQQGWSARAAPCLQGPRGGAWMCLWGTPLLMAPLTKGDTTLPSALSTEMMLGSCISTSFSVFPPYFTIVKDPPGPPLPCPSM